MLRLPALLAFCVATCMAGRNVQQALVGGAPAPRRLRGAAHIGPHNDGVKKAYLSLNSAIASCAESYKTRVLKAQADGATGCNRRLHRTLVLTDRCTLCVDLAMELCTMAPPDIENMALTHCKGYYFR